MAKGTALPSIKSVLMMHDNEAVFTMICENFLPDVVGAKKWKTYCADKKMSGFVNSTDIAFLVLLLSNCWDRWVTAVTGNKNAKNIPTKYTTKTQLLSPEQNKENGNNNAALKKEISHCKWTLEGLEEYARLNMLVKSQRGTEAGQEFEARFLRKMQEKYNHLKKPGEKRTPRKQESSFVMPFELPTPE